ncbi:hypothetical protein pdam_00005511 [Pocillopora damicornis]|uniref:Uncharacterized protein n=1 Tax=Pocillopora damicornis TaxID=46731 RepID=A0A3M6TAI9_POCDA|nr:hypothetical protein pdam_00005511 [Pocillopora damicornis]
MTVVVSKGLSRCSTALTTSKSTISSWRKAYSLEQSNYCKTHQTLFCRSKARTYIDYLEVSMNSFTEKSIPTLFVTKSTSVWDF